MDNAATLHNCGIYRAIVAQTDPARHRLEVVVPELSGNAPLGWALPCVAVTTAPIVLPAVGSTVWVMFERGDALHPVWLGTWIGVR